MFEGIGIADLLDFGVAGMAVFAVIFGLLIPRSSHNRELETLRQEKEAWRELALQAIGSGKVAVTALESLKEEAAKQ